MQFLKPTKKKFLTTVIFIIIGLAFSATSNFTSKVYKEYVKKTHFEGERLEQYKAAMEKESLASSEKYNRIYELVKNIPPEAHRKVELAGWLNIWFTVLFGIVLTYIGACFAHREPKPRSAT